MIGRNVNVAAGFFGKMGKNIAYRCKFLVK